MLYQITNKGTAYIDKYGDQYGVERHPNLDTIEVLGKEHNNFDNIVVGNLIILCDLANSSQVWGGAELPIKILGEEYFYDKYEGWREDKIVERLSWLLRYGYISSIDGDVLSRSFESIIDSMNNRKIKTLSKLYIKMVFDQAREEEINQLYLMCKDMVLNSLEDKGSFYDDAYKFSVLFFQETNKKLACDYVMQALHDRNMVSEFAGLANRLLGEENHYNDDYRRLISILDLLYSNHIIWDITMGGVHDIEERKVLERNSEHKRKILKPAKKKKVQEITKRHIFRKSISG